MAYIENNSTNIPLGAFQRFTGKSFKPSVDFVTIAIALNIPTSGTLQILHSFDDINYFTFGDEYSYTSGSHSHQFSVKANFFKVSFENSSVAQSSFNLNTRILKVISEDFVLNKDFDTITVFPPQTGFLNSETDSITIPTLDACITGINNDSLKVFVVNQSGGSASNVQIFDSNGDSLLSDGSGKLQVSGTFDVGLTNYALENDGHLQSVDTKLDIVQGLTFLNNKLLVETGITGYSTNSKLDEIKTAIIDKHLNSTTDSVAVTSSTLATSALQTTANTKLDTINTTITNKHLDSTTDSVNVNLITGFATSALQTSTNTKLDTIHTDLTSIDGKIDGVLTTDSSDNLLVYSSNIASTPLISGFATEETLQEIKVKTDDLTFSDNGGVIELRVFDSQNNISLNTINDTITNKHLDSATDSVTVSGTVSIGITGLATESTLSSLDGKVNNDTTLTDAIQVAIKNNILVVDPINNSINEAPYDLIINGPAVYADSLPAGNPFFADLNGREGWYYDNQSNILNKSNIYWYANPTTGIFQENDMTFSQLNNMYSVITCDYVDNNELTIPTLGVYSQPTGVNDFLPTFAHSRWVYQLSGTNLNKLRKGETILIYTGATRPTVHINLPSYPLNLVSQNGQALGSEIVAYMTVNTQATTSKIGYLLQYCGYLNSAVGFNREYSFKNSQERLSQLNLSSLTFEDGELIIYSADITSAIASKHLEFGYDKVDVSGSSVSISNLPENQVVSGTVAFSNTSIDVSGTVAFSNTSIEVSSMPNLNYNLDSVTIVPNGDSLPVNIVNQPIAITGINFEFPSGITVLNTSFEISNFPQIQQVAFDGGITVLNTSFEISNFPQIQQVAFDGGITVLNTSFEISNLPQIQQVAGGITVLNSFFESRIQSFHNGNWVNVISASNGHLLVNSSTQDGDGNDILSVVKEGVRGLNTASDIYGYNGTNRIVVAVDSVGRVLTKSNVASGTGDDITATTTTATTQSLDTASSLYTTDGSTRSALSSTAGSLNTNITNQISGFALESTLTTTNGKLDTGNGYLNTINNATGDFTTTFAFGNFISNESIAGGSDSGTDTFTRGSYKRNVIAIYRDSSTANTDSISFYTVSTAGSPNNLLLAQVYPITVGGFRQVTINLNLLPFNSLFIKNDSASTINNVYLTVLNG